MKRRWFSLMARLNRWSQRRDDPLDQLMRRSYGRGWNRDNERRNGDR